MAGLIAILCSGQGGQHAGMFNLVADAPEAQPVFSAAAELLQVDPRDFVRTASPADLFSNRNGQILCCTQALAVWAALGSNKPKRAVIAGYSVGELASWGVAGMLDAPTTLHVAAQRAQAMDTASPPDGGMAGIIGLTRTLLEPILARHSANIAITNETDSFVIGGHKPDLEAICAEAMANGARRAVLIPVTVPSHTTFLAGATPVLARILEAAAPVMPPYGYRVLTTLDGGSIEHIPEAIDKLSRQVSSMIRWSTCLDSCRSAGAKAVLELGPGVALSKMADNRFPEGAARSADDFRTLTGLSDWLREFT